MELKLLADHPSAASLVAQWYVDEWHNDKSDANIKLATASVEKFVNRNTAPLMILAIQGKDVIGAVELKIREMDIYPNYEHWVGGVYVREESRGCGVAEAMVLEVLQRAKSADIERLYLQTSDHSGGLYAKCGFEPVEKVIYKGEHVLVMCRQISR